MNIWDFADDLVPPYPKIPCAEIWQYRDISIARLVLWWRSFQSTGQNTVNFRAWFVHRADIGMVLLSVASELVLVMILSEGI